MKFTVKLTKREGDSYVWVATVEETGWVTTGVGPSEALIGIAEILEVEIKQRQDNEAYLAALKKAEDFK